jgi:hypothetical protein
MQSGPAPDTGVAGQITKAVGAHGQWKARLGAAIASGTSEFDAATVRQDDKCDFGKWLYQSIGQRDRATAHYTKVKQLHAQFHTEAARVLSLAVGGKKAEAERAMAPGSAFFNISTQLTQEMLSWKKDTA